MSKYYREYFWKEGMPYGVELLYDPVATCYKIAMDPYRKKISLEKYAWGNFEAQVYNSRLLDFRHLRAENQLAWEKIVLTETPQKMRSLIRDQDDCVAFIEEYQFTEGRCVKCCILSPHDVLLATQHMYYKELKDEFNGVILFDANGHPVIRKEYALDATGRDFGELIKESWDMQSVPFK